MDYNEMLSSYGGSVLGLITITAIAAITYCCKKKCQHQKCKSHTYCCEFESQEDSIEKQRRKTESKDNLLELLKELKVIPNSPDTD